MFKKIIAVSLFLIPTLSFAQVLKTPSAGSDINTVSVGSFDIGTYVDLVNDSFTGCSRTNGAMLVRSNPNYDHILTALLAAKMSEKKVRIFYVGGDACVFNYPYIKEVLIF